MSQPKLSCLPVRLLPLRLQSADLPRSHTLDPEDQDLLLFQGLNVKPDKGRAPVLKGTGETGPRHRHYMALWDNTSWKAFEKKIPSDT